MDVAKVDRNIVYFCKCFQWYITSVLKKNISSVSNICCNKCFIWMLHMFHTHVASVLSGYCICFIHILQVFYLDVAYISLICCNSMF
jgi:hypothetical protein